MVGVVLQSRSDIGVHIRHSNLPGVNFLISDEALEKLTALLEEHDCTTGRSFFKLLTILYYVIKY